MHNDEGYKVAVQGVHNPVPAARDGSTGQESSIPIYYKYKYKYDKYYNGGRGLGYRCRTSFWEK